MLLETQTSMGRQFLVRIAGAIIVGFAVSYLFKLLIYDRYISIRTFPDYGPTLFAGGQPDMLLYLYVVLVIASVLIGLTLNSPSVRIPFLDQWSRAEGGNSTAVITVLLMVITISVTGIVTGGMHRMALLIPVFAGMAAYVAGRPLVAPAATRLAAFANTVFALVFTVIFLFHLPKISVLLEIFAQSGERNAALGLFVGLLFIAVTVGYLLARSRSSSEWMRLSLALVAIYVVSIRESWIYWGLDSFHEGELFLTPNFLVNGPYTFLVDFFPVHGLGRNILHGYYAAIFSGNNLYFYRVAQALTYPFVHVLVAAFLYRYTKGLAVPLAFFVLSYLFGILEERDIAPFLLVAFLLIPRSGDNGRNSIVLQVATGIALFATAVYSFEFFVLLNIAMVVTLAYYFYVRVRYSQRQIPWLHISFFGCFLVFLAALGPAVENWFDFLRNALMKSPNLLERSLMAPDRFSFSFFLISAFFALFLLFHVSSVVAFLRGSSRSIVAKDMLVVIFSMLSLMFFVRAFNRSDIGHVLYAYSISLPAIIGLAIHYKITSERSIILVALCLLAFFVVNCGAEGRLSLDVLRQRPLYDSRLSLKDVRPLQDFGAIKVPARTISDASHMTPVELEDLQSLVRDGYRIFDMTNQPVLMYGAVKSPLITNDIHTMFYSNYGEQMAVIKSLEAAGKAIVLWSANHWSETLDSTYVEYRLPILSEYVCKAYPFTYKVGRFVIFADHPLPVGEAIADGSLRDQYDLGRAPSRMGPYGQEHVSVLTSINAERVNIGASKPDAVLIDVTAEEEGRIYLDMIMHGRKLCTVTFVVAEGNSENFVRLSSLPAYLRFRVDELVMRLNKPSVRVNQVRMLRLTSEVDER